MVALTIYEILYPHCSGKVLGMLTQALTGSGSFDVFHERLLRQFIPVRQLSQLCIERYERAQAEGESLAVYIQSIRDAALILRISVTTPGGTADCGEINTDSTCSVCFSGSSFHLRTVGALDRC
jgi:hypothetical protein